MCEKEISCLKKRLKKLRQIEESLHDRYVYNLCTEQEIEKSLLRNIELTRQEIILVKDILNNYYGVICIK